jgi:hypothetical protein
MAGPQAHRGVLGLAVSTRRWASVNRSRSSGWMMSEAKALWPTRSSDDRPRIRWTAGLMERMPPSASKMAMMSGEALMTACRVASRPRTASSACRRSVTSIP